MDYRFYNKIKWIFSAHNFKIVCSMLFLLFCTFLWINCKFIIIYRKINKYIDYKSLRCLSRFMYIVGPKVILTIIRKYYQTQTHRNYSVVMYLLYTTQKRRWVFRLDTHEAINFLLTYVWWFFYPRNEGVGRMRWMSVNSLSYALWYIND